MMKFAPKPENDFACYIKTYYEECRARFDGIEAIAGKWMFRDLIPGMSDFDTRFIVKDGMTADDWCKMSTAIGEAHHLLCRLYPCWSRNLEHLPGINLTWQEFLDERMYLPEYRQWTFYNSEVPGNLSLAREQLAKRTWSLKDEYFFLKKFCLYYGRYNRTIDPAINLGIHENKYPLHSRIMHYFEPPVQAAVILLKKNIVAGKFDALEIAAALFPELKCWDFIFEILHANYEIPAWYEDKKLVMLEDELEHALQVMAEAILPGLTIVPKQSGTDIDKWREKVAAINIDPAMKIIEHSKFSRLMKGRLWFYSHAPEHFDFTWLIQNELNRINRNFFGIPFETFYKLKFKRSPDNSEQLINRLQSEGIISDQDAAATSRFDLLTRNGCQPGTEKETALKMVDLFDDFYHTLSTVSEAALKL